jgi:hypothetical protein
MGPSQVTIKRENWKFAKCPKCSHEFSTEAEWSVWTRQQQELDSKLQGFSFYDIDIVWEGPSGGNPGESPYMMIEVKCKMETVKKGQLVMMSRVAKRHKGDQWWRGFHILQFEELGPKSGTIFLDGRKITEEELLCFYSFKAPGDWYDTTFRQILGT